MGPKDGVNLSKVNYFPLEEYVNRIKINDKVLNHLEETNKEFDKYLKKLAKYDDYSVIHYWIDSLAKEYQSSQAIENKYINYSGFNNDLFFDRLPMSHARIKRIHKFINNSEDIESYRNIGHEIKVSSYDSYTGEEKVYWNGVESKDLRKFMDDFLKIYKTNSLSLIVSNPFLKSALVCLLFIRIHPFTDGNGRTGRMLYNIKFTEMINKIYGSKLKLCPLNISHGILMHKKTYANKLYNIYFDLEHDSNDEINDWFDFILNRADDAIFFNNQKISKLDRSFNNIKNLKNTDTSNLPEETSKMKIKKIIT